MSRRAPTLAQVHALAILCQSHLAVERATTSREYGYAITTLFLVPGPFRRARQRFTLRLIYAIGTRAFALQCFLDQWRVWWAGRPIYRTCLHATREVCEEASADPTPAERDAQAFRAMLELEVPNWSDGGGEPSLN